MPARGATARLAASFAGLALLLGSAAVAQNMGGGTGPPSQWGAAPCSGHGHHDFGRCFCDPGWAGDRCDITEKPLDCGLHGKASHGWCVCEPGWKGGACQTAPLVCTHGKAAHGKCVCDAGWSGGACNNSP
jgi:hypothetical protein